MLGLPSGSGFATPEGASMSAFLQARSTLPPDEPHLLHLLRSHKHPVCAVAFSPDGKLLASAGGSSFDPDEEGRDCSIRVWSCATWKEARRLLGHPARVTSLAFAPNGKMLASAD